MYTIGDPRRPQGPQESLTMQLYYRYIVQKAHLSCKDTVCLQCHADAEHMYLRQFNIIGSHVY